MAKARFSPTVKTLAYLRERGFPCCVVEKFIKFGKFGIRRDSWGADLQCLAGDATIGIQAGIGSMHAAKIKKALELPEVRQWLASSSRWFWVMTWSKKVAFNANGHRRKNLLWFPRVSQIKLVDGELVVSDFILK